MGKLAWNKSQLCHADRWQGKEMLRERPALEREDENRDIGLWLRLFAPTDLVKIGEIISEAGAASADEMSWGCIWRRDGVPKSVVAYCVPARELLRGLSCAEALTQREACEAAIGRMRATNLPILLVVEDGEDGLEVWIDAVARDYRLSISRGRCPGGRNKRTGRLHRVVWAYEGLWEEWREEDWCPGEVTPEPDWLDTHVNRVIGWVKARDARRKAW